MVRWLHISDLHIQNKADWSSFRKELFRKCGDIGKIDLVIVTGDFHNFVEGHNFELAKSFLRELIQECHLDINKDLFLIPGNHDGTTDIPDKKMCISAVKYAPLDIEKTWMEKLLDMFQDYETFVKELIPEYPTEHPAKIHNRIWRDKINFIHCNSAIAADGEDKSNQLLDVDELAAADYSDDYPNIMLVHNNFDDLQEDVQKRVKDIVRNNFVRAYLCGDRHLESISMISYEDRQNRQVPCVGCYKLSPDAKDQYSKFGIIVGEWQGEYAELRGWHWESGVGFKIDGSITEQKIYMGCLETIEKAKVEEAIYKGKDEKSDLDECEESYYQKREFITRYRNISPNQLRKFNRKYGDEFGELHSKESETALYEYVNSAEKNGILENMLDYMKSL